MSIKRITKDCDKCFFMKIHEDGRLECFYGKNKKIKILKECKGKIRNCKLIEKDIKL